MRLQTTPILKHSDAYQFFIQHIALLFQCQVLKETTNTLFFAPFMNSGTFHPNFKKIENSEATERS
ncbi:hypothetical protein [Winogradskyella psychrotolerans]|uniref:hypothetical protein n=1 Tax=Winogradskyella psychrotolerans TaxID=1344585 RepID=UPI001C067586|nr:hypothetical protein [Winogradskyella psychrotolerans]MBU2926826.1 hypothetical protein [Winogradskyella psychrotolerans]